MIEKKHYPEENMNSQEEEIQEDTPVFQEQTDDIADQQEYAEDDLKTISEEELLSDLRTQQNLPFAFLGGLLAALISALLWATLTVATEYQYGVMAVVVGFVVGMAVRYFGAGVDIIYGILGAFFSFLGCLFGNFFAQVGFVAHECSYGYLETFSYMDIPLTFKIMFESFQPMDILFYGIAIYEGFKFSILQVKNGVALNHASPALQKWRMPLAIVVAIVLCVLYSMFTKGYSGPKTHTYESGAMMSQGNIKNGKYDGAWTFYYENGTTQGEGYFYKDVRDGDWKWYTEEGVLQSIGFYEKGSETDVWVSYYDGVIPYDSTMYKNGRKDGKYVSLYEDGTVSIIGNYKLDKEDGLWRGYYKDGQLSYEGNLKEGQRVGEWYFYFENGDLFEELYYEEDGSVRVKNSWSEDGKEQEVKDGNGEYKIFFNDGVTLRVIGNIESAKRVGVWKTYFEDGSLQEEAEYRDDVCCVINAWNNKGEQTVNNGNGQFVFFWSDSIVSMTGEYQSGLKEGMWSSYDHMGNLADETEYKNGKRNGKSTLYNTNGTIAVEGQYANDKPQGEWKWYNENGELSSSIKYINDKKEGILFVYDNSGNFLRKEEYKSGELVDVRLKK